MNKIITIGFIVLLLGSCSISKRVERKYNGKTSTEIIRDFGAPIKIEELSDGITKFVYKKETFVKATEIGTGSFTLDKPYSPAFIKEETYIFLINKSNEIIDTKYTKKVK